MQLRHSLGKLIQVSDPPQASEGDDIGGGGMRVMRTGTEHSRRSGGTQKGKWEGLQTRPPPWLAPGPTGAPLNVSRSASPT